MKDSQAPLSYVFVPLTRCLIFGVHSTHAKCCCCRQCAFTLIGKMSPILLTRRPSVVADAIHFLTGTRRRSSSKKLSSTVT